MADDTATLPGVRSIEHDETHFVFERQLGHGASGAVFLVRDRKTGERLALKKLFRMDGRSVLRLKREFRAMASMNHPNLVKLYELGRAKDAWFLTMEYLEGRDLGSYLRGTSGDAATSGTFDASPAPLELIVPAFYQVARGVQALHAAGMLHRDLKPSNVLVADKRFVVLDFGLVRDLSQHSASETEEGLITGTPAYMAPEQATGSELSAASDWYAFGVMLYQAFSGYLPIEGSLMEVLQNKLQQDPIPLEECADGVPADVAALCNGLLARDPRLRPRGEEVLAVLSALRQQRERSMPVPLSTATHDVATSSGRRLFGRESELSVLQQAFALTCKSQFVVAHVSGPSGTGKSALIEHFLNELELDSAAASGGVLTLRGRCYEQESMPFKALDAVMDSLVRYLASLDDLAVAHLLPTEVETLSQLFPALSRLRAVQRLLPLAKAAVDVVFCRQRAESVLRELFHRLGSRRPLVIWIDDLQWGDLDSAAILKRWLHEPLQGQVLLLLSYRNVEVDTSACLKHMLERRENDAARLAVEQTLQVPPLDARALTAICEQRLSEHAPKHPELVERIVREAQGSPYLAGQLSALAEAKLVRGDLDLGTISVDGLVAQFAALLPDHAKGILALLAVAGRPISPKLAFDALELDRDQNAALHVLRGLNLVRTRDLGGERLLEVYHDRVRERVQSTLTREVRIELHERLLRILERSGASDSDWLHALALGAEQRELALRYGLVAAERASNTLAFVRASELYQTCLGLTDASSKERGELWLQLATALARCGRGVRAADAYLEAAKHSANDQAIPLMRCAASHLLRSGRFEEGETVLREVMAAMQLEVPETEAKLKLAVGWEHARLAVRGWRFSARSDRELSPNLLARIDLFQALGTELFPFDVLRAALFQARGQRLALDSGEPRRVVAALCTGALHIAIGGGVAAAREVDVLLSRAEGMSRELGSESDYGRARATRAISAYMLGECKQVIEPSYEVERICEGDAEGHLHDSYQRRFSSVSCRIGAWIHLGEIERFSTEFAALLREAEDTENRLAMLQLCLNQTFADELAGKFAQTQARLERQKGLLPAGRFGILQCLHMMSILRCSLASHEYAWADAVLGDGWERFQRSLVRRAAMLAASAYEAHAHWNISRHVHAARSGAVPDAVRSEIHALEKLRHMAWCRPAAARLRARLAYLSGDRDSAMRLLRHCADDYAAMGCRLYAAQSSYALGRVVGGDEGADLIRNARESLRSSGASAPDLVLTTYCPELQG